MNILTLFLVFSSFLVLTYGSEDQKKKKSKKVPKTHGFFVGQIPLGRFEYPELNTLLKPNQAQIICENDLECAGFTFKGPKNHLDIPHPITFFRFVSESTFTETKRANLHWTSYRVKRNFVIVAGKKFPNSRVTDEKPEKKVLSRMSKMITNQDVKMMEKFKWALESPALVLDLFRNSAEPHTHLDYAELSPAGDITTTTLTIVDMGAKESDVLDSTISQIDRCCEEQASSEVNMAELTGLKPVAMESCSLRRAPFLKSYVRQLEPVHFTACAATCTTQNYTLTDLIQSFEDPQDATWEATFRGGSSKAIETGKIVEALQQDPESWTSLSAAISPLAAPRINRFTLDHDLGKFGPDSGDLLAEMSARQWKKFLNWYRQGSVRIAETSGQGIDAKYTLISGMQLWILSPFPPRGSASPLACSDKCSGKAADLKSWLVKIVPQVKNLLYGGQQISQTILLPGDTLYLPHNWYGIHIDLEDSVQFRDLELSEECIEDSAVRMGSNELNIFKRFLNTKEERKRLQRRFDGTLKQVATAKAKLKHMKNEARKESGKK